MRYYKVISSVLPVRTASHGETVKFAALIPADSVRQAERYVREDKRFRRQMRQSELDWKLVPLTVKRSSLKEGI